MTLFADRQHVMCFSGAGGVKRYGFNGKELDTEGMGGGLSTYDYGFRIYNPALGKFLSTDPLSKEYPWYTPYQFAGNKPVIAMDLDGKEELIVTNFYDSANQLYKTEIQVTNGGNINNGLNTQQIVHYNSVQLAPTGDATVTYQGSTAGTRAPVAAAGSTALPSTLNSIVWSQELFIEPVGSGNTVQATTFFGAKEGGNVQLMEASGGVAAPFAGLVGAGSGSSNKSADGLFTIDWVAKAANGEIPGADIAPFGVAGALPNPTNTAMLSPGINNTPIGAGNLTPLSAGAAEAMGVSVKAVDPNTPNVAQFTQSPNDGGKFSAGRVQETLGGPGTAAQSVGSQADETQANSRGNSNYTVTPQ